MLKVQTNVCRSAVNIDGIWRFKTVDNGFLPVEPLKEYRLMPVPASMNDVVTEYDLREYVGKVAYETLFSCPVEKGREYRVRIGAASHKCKVYLNGEYIGGSESAFLPVDLLLPALKENNRLTVVIDNRLDYHTLPSGRIVNGNDLFVYDQLGKYAVSGDKDRFPKEKQIINHDFYNYTGIHRSVLIYSLPEKHIDDIVIRTVVNGDYHAVSAELKGDGTDAVYTVTDENDEIVSSGRTGGIHIKDPHLWQVGKSYLYTLTVRTATDCYREKFGIRKISFDDRSLYVNDEPVYLKGFGMHEDFPVIGKGNNSAVNIRDFELLKWINANCFRTSHYPYAEEIMDLADEYGMLVVDEVPAVGCNNWPDYTYGKDRLDDVTLALHKNSLRIMLERDKNHPCMAMVSVANEAATYEDASREYFSEVIGYVRSLTDLPVTTAELTRSCEGNKIGDLVDFIGLNRYFGWYDEIGNIKAAEPLLKRDLEAYYKQFGKPIIMFEFGAEGIEGLHSAPALAFSEEYQTEFLKEYSRVFDELPYVQGELVWNFADFMTKQGTIRVNGNRKGVFTRERQPKSAAFYLKERWKNKNEK